MASFIFLVLALSGTLDHYCNKMEEQHPWMTTFLIVLVVIGALVLIFR